MKQRQSTRDVYSYWHHEKLATSSHSTSPHHIVRKFQARIYTRKTCPQTHYTVVNLFTRIQELKQHRKNRTDKKNAHISNYTYKPRNTSLLKTKLKSHVALPSKLQIKLQLSDCEAWYKRRNLRNQRRRMARWWEIGDGWGGRSENKREMKGRTKKVHVRIRNWGWWQQI